MLLAFAGLSVSSIRLGLGSEEVFVLGLGLGSDKLGLGSGLVTLFDKNTRGKEEGEMEGFLIIHRQVVVDEEGIRQLREVQGDLDLG